MGWGRQGQGTWEGSAGDQDVYQVGAGHWAGLTQLAVMPAITPHPQLQPEKTAQVGPQAESL